MSDERARHLIEHDLERTLLVEAAAGTGKTSMLARRVASLLATGRTTTDRLVVVTFTEKAAGELVARVRVALEARRASDDEALRARVEAAIVTLDLAHVSTIHSFFTELLRERPIEAGIDPAFEVLDETGRDALLRELVTDYIARRIERPTPAFAALRDRTAEGDLEKVLLDVLRRLVDQRDLDADWPPARATIPLDALEACLADLTARAREAPVSPAPEPLAPLLTELARALSSWREAWDAAPGDLDGAAATSDEARATSTDDDGLRLLATREALEALLAMRAPAEREQKRAARGPARELVEAFLDATAELADLADDACARALVRELRALLPRYDLEKTRRGLLDFFDLLAKTRALLSDDERVRADIASRFDAILIDEAQDVGPLEADVFFLLAQPEQGARSLVPGKLFFVGDPKQSIYGFRRADIATYHALVHRLREGDAEHLFLTRTFRARAPLVHLVNRAFATAFVEGPHQVAYVPLEPERREDDDDLRLPPLFVLDHDERAPNKVKESDYAGALATTIVRLVREGALVEEHGTRVPFAPRHLVLIGRSLRGQWDPLGPYREAFALVGLPLVLADEGTLLESEEIGALRLALTAIEWPGDLHAVYATLRGPLFGVSDAELFLHVRRRGPLDPFVEPEVPRREWTRIDRALAQLFTLHRVRTRRTLAELLRALLEETDLEAQLALTVDRDERLRRITQFMAMARDADHRDVRSLRRWLDELDERAVLARPLPESELEDGVRVMTVHGAKGLEFPVVALIGPTMRASFAQPREHVDRIAGVHTFHIGPFAPADVARAASETRAKDREESLRLAYVAATRAKETLLLPPAHAEGWLDELGRAARETAPEEVVRLHVSDAPSLESEQRIAARPGALVSTQPLADGAARPESAAFEDALAAEAEAMSLARARPSLEPRALSWHATRPLAALDATADVDELELAVSLDLVESPRRLQHLTIELVAAWLDQAHLSRVTDASASPTDLARALATSGLVRSLAIELGATDAEERVLTELLAEPALGTRVHALAASSSSIRRRVPLVGETTTSRIALRGLVPIVVEAATSSTLLDVALEGDDTARALSISLALYRRTQARSRSAQALVLRWIDR